MESQEKPSEPVKAPMGPITVFTIKTAIVVAAIILVMSYINTMVEQQIARVEQQIARVKDNFGHIGGREFWSKIEHEIENQADPKSDLPPEKKKKILAQIRAISDRWRPFITEAVAAFNGAASEPPKQ